MLEVSVSDILTFGEKIANFFDKCNGNVSGINNGTANNFDAKELQQLIPKPKIQFHNSKSSNLACTELDFFEMP